MSKQPKRPATGHRAFKRASCIGRRTSKRAASKKACRGKPELRDA